MNVNFYELTNDQQGYAAGTVLLDVSLQAARAMECNRCGDCCNGLREDVVKDEATGLPKFTWGSEFPADRYKARYGTEMLLPIVRGDGGPEVGDDFEEMNGQPYTAFKCAHLVEHDQGPDWPHDPLDKDPRPGGDCRTSCGLMARFGDNPDPNDLSQHRPRNCGEFPVYGSLVDSALIDGHSFIPATGVLPRCTWHGIRVTGPWRQEPYWVDRWEKQQRGEPVEELGRVDEAVLAAFMEQLLARRATVDGSVPKTVIP